MGICVGCVRINGTFTRIFVDRMKEEESRVMDFIEEQRPMNTRKTYTTYGEAYIRFAQEKKLNYLSPITVASFMKFAALEMGLSRTTVCSVIPASIGHIFRYTPTTSPVESAIVCEMKKALQHVTETPGKGRQPLTMEQLRQISAMVTREPGKENIRNMFMILLMMSGFMRASEVVSLRAEDVTLMNGDVLSIEITKSKTDQGRQGATIVITNMEKDIAVCPVYWFFEYLKIRNQQAVYFFHRLGQKSDITVPLSPSTPNFVVKSSLMKIGIEPKGYGSHSCRKGGCSAAVNAGLDMRLIMEHGRWKSDSVRRYITDSLPNKLSISKGVLGNQ